MSYSVFSIQKPAVRYHRMFSSNNVTDGSFAIATFGFCVLFVRYVGSVRREEEGPILRYVLE